MKTLRDWVPYEALDYTEDRFFKYLDQKVVQEYGLGGGEQWKSWPGTHKNVLNWCVLENGFAVGWNENPSTGWSFPVVRVNKSPEAD